MTEYKRGQRVRVEVEGVIDWTLSDGRIRLRQPSGFADYVRVTAPDAKVTVLDPPDWPPQVGDIWEADGMEYHAEEWHRDPYDPVTLVLQPSSHRPDTWAYSNDSCYEKNLDDFKALNPVLVRRRGQ